MVRECFREIRDEEQESYDNIPESLQETDRANTIYENIDYLDTMVSDLDDILEGSTIFNNKAVGQSTASYKNKYYQ